MVAMKYAILLLFLFRWVLSDVCETILLSANGTDTPECIKSSCRSLDFVVQKLNITSSCVKINIFDNQSLDANWTITARNFSMQGMGASIVITCALKVGILFNGSGNVLISNVEFMNCGISEGQTAAITVHNCVNLSVDRCTFVNSPSIGLVVSDSQDASSYGDDVTRQYFIKNSLFNGNNHNNQVDYSDLGIQNALSGSKTRHSGGGLSVGFKRTEKTHLTLLNCSFVSNYGWIGGGAYINANSFTNSTLVLVKDCKFIGNMAGLLGGGLCIGASEHIADQVLDLYIELEDVVLANNSAPHAGGFAYHTKGQLSNTAGAIVNITNTTFTGNVANFSGAGVGLFKWQTKVGVTSVVANFRNCTWTDNSIYQTFTDNSTESGIGVLYTQGVPFALLGNTVITNNYGTAILASLAEIYLWDQVMISNNTGVRGGAVSLIANSQMVVHKGLNLTFAYNHAKLMGGAIYHVYPIMGVTGQNEYCVFVYCNRSATDPADWNADIHFIENNALVSGLSIFLSSADTCKQNEKGEIFTENVFHFLPSYENQITSSPVRMSFASDSIDCSDDGIYRAKVMLGEKMRLTVNAVDAFGNHVKGFAAVSLNCLRENGSIASSSECDYRLEGTDLVEFSGKPQRVSFYITGTRQSNFSNHILLTWQLIELPIAVGYLHVNIRSCYLGYIYDANLQTCVCYNKDEHVICNDAEYIACVSFGYWYGEIMTNETGAKEFATSACSFGSCDYTVNGQCPTEQCGPDGSAYQFHCKLPRDDPDSLCLYNKGGITCSKCQENFLPTLPNLKCVHKDKCHLGYLVIQVVMYFLFLFTAISLVVLVARFDLRIGSGQIYCLVFYFSVFKYFVGGVFPSAFLHGVEIFFTAVVQINPAILGLIPLCSGIKTNALLSVFLQLINPMVLFLAICIILYVPSKWPKYAVLKNRRLGINAVCIMLYLCFVSITQTSLTLLSPVRFHNIEGVYTLLDPTIEYFSLKHLGYGLVALLLQILLVFPFLGLLLFSPFLIRFKKLNLTKIKPILDEFQACFKTEYRYFAGFYLACRQLIFLMSFINLGAFAYIYILQILSITILTFHLMIQPYKSKLLNILDGLLILDLVLLSLLHGNTAAIVFDDVIEFKITIIYVLVLLPVVYLVILCASHSPFAQSFLLCMRKCLKNNKLVKTLAKPLPVKNHTLNTSPGIRTTVVDLADSDITKNEADSVVEPIEREPLLFMNSTSSSDYESNAQAVVSEVWSIN